MEFEIIDFHTHLARTPEEESNYWLFPGRRDCDRYGTPEQVVGYMHRGCISKIAFMTLIPRQYRGPLFEKAKLAALPEAQRLKEFKRLGEQVAPIMREINEWGCRVGKQFPQLLPFSCVSPDLGGSNGMVKEVELRAEQGARGIKLHPGIFSFFPNDEVMWPVYKKCQELGLPILADSGPWPPTHVLAEYPAFLVASAQTTVIDYGEPKNWTKICEAFPRLTIILAHLGAAWWDERMELAKQYPNIYFDTAQGFCSPGFMPFNPHRGLAEEDAPRIIRKIGVDRVLFGTDFAAVAPQPQIDQILRLPLTDEEKQKILSGNAKRLLHL